MKTCPACQHTYPDDFSVCPRDGAHLAAQATETDAQLAAGLSRRFRLVRRLGAGGMGTVFLAEQIGVGNRPVALKVLNRQLLDNPDFLLRFQNEAAATGRIRHSNVVTIYESGQADDGTPYIAMEFLEGESLGDTLQRRGVLPVAEAAEILQQAAKGLNAAHELGIIHRDLKPDNIFLTQGDDGEMVVKVVDFGIAKLRESAIHTKTDVLVGTLAYMSSEQASGMRSDDLDARSDVYSLGVVAYKMLTGRLPFQSDTEVGYIRMHMQDAPPPFHAVAPGLDVPPELESAVMKALAKDRDQRYGSALDFTRELTGAAQPSRRMVNSKDGLTYMWIPPGTFQMGDDSSIDYEELPHLVTITKGFWLGQTEVTVGAYKRFAKGTGKDLPDAPDFNSGWSNEQMPIVNVSWEEAQAYCAWAGGRLPTEAEWEYAARAGSIEERYGPINEVAWHSDNSLGRTHEVGQKRANAFGLYDMLGNVAEWVNDWWDEEYYQNCPPQDPAGPAGGEERILRGGSWYNHDCHVRVPFRFSFNPGVRVKYLGFRCAREVFAP